MSDQPDLVSLLYRADWTRLSLAAEVTTSRDFDLDRYGGDVFSPPPWLGAPRKPPRTAHVWEMATDRLGTRTDRSTLLIEPGWRYREQGEDHLSGCDGDRSWSAVREGGGWKVEADDRPEPPLPPMLRPSWLLAGFTLETSGPVTTGGREALRAVATPRPGVWPRASAGHRPLDRVEVVVDAGLGILLRREEILDGRTLSVTELSSIRTDLDPADDGRFLPPGGWDSVQGDAPRTTPRGPAWEASKLIAGLTAGGLGALIKSSRSRSFEQATREEPDAEMPPDAEPLPADGPAVTDEVLHLLRAGRDRWAPGIAATLHEWNDVSALLSRVPDGARRAGFGGVGFLLDKAGERIDTAHTVSRLRLGNSGQYRIEQPASPGEDDSGRFARVRAKTVVCDGERRWRIGEDRVTVSPAAPPYDIPNLFDASWLLEYPLTGGAAIVAGGRRGYRLTVASGDRPGGCWLFVPDEVVVDAEFGIVLRWISLAGGRPVMRYELRDVVAGSFDPGDFRPDLPAGVKVGAETWDQPPSGPVNPVGFVARQAASQARSALRSVLGVIRGGDGP